MTSKICLIMEAHYRKRDGDIKKAVGPLFI